MNQVLRSSITFLDKCPNQIKNEFQRLPNPCIYGDHDPEQFPELSEGLLIQTNKFNKKINKTT